MDIKSQLNRCCDFIDILPAGTRRADKVKLQFALINVKGGCDLKHDKAPTPALPIFELQKMGRVPKAGGV